MSDKKNLKILGFILGFSGVAVFLFAQNVIGLALSICLMIVGAIAVKKPELFIKLDEEIEQ